MSGKQEEFYKDVQFRDDISTGGYQFESSTSQSGKSERKSRLRLQEQIIQDENYQTAKKKGNPAALSKYFILSSLPYDYYDPRIEKNKKKTMYDLFVEGIKGRYINEDDELKFVDDYFQSYEKKQQNIRKSPWLRHIRVTAGLMNMERREALKTNPNFKFKRGELFRRAARTFGYNEGRRYRKEMPYSLVGSTATLYGAKIKLRKKSQYKRALPYDYE